MLNRLPFTNKFLTLFNKWCCCLLFREQTPASFGKASCTTSLSKQIVDDKLRHMKLLRSNKAKLSNTSTLSKKHQFIRGVCHEPLHMSLSMHLSSNASRVVGAIFVLAAERVWRHVMQLDLTTNVDIVGLTGNDAPVQLLTVAVINLSTIFANVASQNKMPGFHRFCYVIFSVTAE